jgi:hypothetical protein
VSGVSIYERLLEPGCTELPDCRCGKLMDIAGFEATPDRADSHIRIYRCEACTYELRLTIWSADAAV